MCKKKHSFENILEKIDQIHEKEQANKLTKFKKINNKKVYILEKHHYELEIWERFKGYNIITLDFHTDTKSTKHKNYLIEKYNSKESEIKNCIIEEAERS